MKYKLLANQKTGRIEIARLDEDKGDKQVIGYLESEWGFWALKHGFQREALDRIDDIQESINEARRKLDAVYKELCVALGK